jgi:hypothetical protein
LAEFGGCEPALLIFKLAASPARDRHGAGTSTKPALRR